MEPWSAHHLFKGASAALGADSAFDVQRYANRLRASNLPVIFSLGHLGKITGIDYDLLHDTVNRRRESANYNLFAIKKRSGRRRFIHAVNGKLFDLQKYLNDHVLQLVHPHPSSFAFHPTGGIRQCAAVHCGCRWLLQFDLQDFFYSVSEPLIYQVFRNLGYKNLLAFELARLCTTLRMPSSKAGYIKSSSNYPPDEWAFADDGVDVIREPYFPQELVGVLPQGAPTSPMLSNLSARKLDNLLFEYAQQHGFVYTRYADDITFSASTLPANKSIGRIQKEIVSVIRKCGFVENKDKIRVAGPGSKKIVLGLLVDGDVPRISREMLRRFDRNLYSIQKYGLESVATHEGFDSAYGFYNHMSGLMAYLKDVDCKRWEMLRLRFKKIEPPF